jgi:hypothetical protein
MKATIRQNAAKALAVTDTRVTVSGFEVRLIASDPPTIMLAGLDETAVLNPTVTSLDLEIEMKIEILQFQILADDKGVSLGGVLLGCLANDSSILDAPKFGITVPTLQRFAVKEIFFRKGGDTG